MFIKKTQLVLKIALYPAVAHLVKGSKRTAQQKRMYIIPLRAFFQHCLLSVGIAIGTAIQAGIIGAYIYTFFAIAGFPLACIPGEF